MRTPSELVNTSGNVIPRVIIEATCTTCGPLDGHEEGAEGINLARAHTEATGHIVVLSGTSDIPEL
jgi:hypothetical protein